MLTILNTACSVVGIRNLEMPEYEVLESDGRFELREYPETLVVETVADGDYGDAQGTAFRRLFGYISGANEANGKIEMTAPVLQEPVEEQRNAAAQKIEMTAPVFQDTTEDGWRMAFVLPSRYSLETAPTPTDSRVEIRRLEPRRVVALRFGGRLTQNSIEEHAPMLERWSEARGLEVISEVRSAGYDPPFTLPFLRRNEVLFEVADTE